MRPDIRMIISLLRAVAFTLILGFVWFLMAGEVARAAAPMAEATRIPLADLRVVGSPDPPLPYEVATVFTDLKVSTPVLLVADPLAIRNRVRSSPGEPFGAHQRFVIGQRYGRLATFSSSGTGKTTTLFLNLTPAEVLSLAFHPRYEENRHVFVLVVRTTPPIPGRRIQLLRFRVEQESPESCDPASETVLLEWDT
ncbi:MAG: hypothetical protein ACKO3P_22020, partial [Planctomycetaceae bacterium]